MNCPSCGAIDSIDIVVTLCLEDGERMRYPVCQECDYGVNDHTEGVCSCA